MTEEYNETIEINWEEAENNWNEEQPSRDENLTKYTFTQENLNTYVKYATTSVQHRYTLFQISDSLKYLCQNETEYNILFWKYLNQTEPLPSREVIPITLPQPESEKCFFNLELKFQQNKIVIEFHSELAIFRDREIPCNTTNRHHAIQSLFQDKTSALVLPLAIYDKSSITKQIANIARFDVLFGSYNKQIQDINQDLESMKSGDFYVTLHSNMFYMIRL